MKTRSEARERIAQNILTHGHHVYIVSGGPTPRWAYTIGLSPDAGFELVLAGGTVFLKDDVLGILARLASHTARRDRTTSFVLPRWGAFRLGPVCRAWSERLLLGANDYYRTVVEALQVVPDQSHRTIDVPDLSRPLTRNAVTPWRWLDEPWPYEISKTSEAMTNLETLMGGRVTEAARWEEDYWEVFSGSGEEVNRDDARLVPMGTLLGADPSLEAIARLEIGEALRREPPGDWETWRGSE